MFLGRLGQRERERERERERALVSHTIFSLDLSSVWPDFNFLFSPFDVGQIKMYDILECSFSSKNMSVLLSLISDFKNVTLYTTTRNAENCNRRNMLFLG